MGHVGHAVSKHSFCKTLVRSFSSVQYKHILGALHYSKCGLKTYHNVLQEGTMSDHV